ncbi:MAG: AMP-binding protein [Planctomycetales bacterium]
MTSHTTCPERLPRSALLDRQFRHLQVLLETNLDRPGFWREKLAQAGVKPSEIRSPSDLSRIPLTTKHELVADQAAHPPYGSAVGTPPEQCLRLHQTSGTTGRPLAWLDTSRNWEWILNCWEQNFRMAGLQPTDRLGFPFSFGPFLSFWAAFEGAQRLGRLCVAGGGLSTSARLKLIFDYQLTVICCTPTYALRMAEVAAAEGLDLANGPVRSLIVAGEPGGCLSTTRSRMEQAWGARVFDHWGMTEIGPLATEVVEDPGHLYVLESECLAEVIDPQTLQPVSPGETGELVITNLGRIDNPLIRYRTGDLVRGEYVPDAAGYHLLRLTGGILGRTDQMITVRGNNVYPAALEELLREFADVVEFRIQVTIRKAMTHLKIEVEPNPARWESGSADLTQQIAHRIKDRLNFQVDVEAVPPETLPRFEMKGKRFQRIVEE